MFDTCLVHIGAEKTGSTSIQSFMQRNRERARDRGFFYPASLGPKNHHNHRWLRNFAANTHEHRAGAVVRLHPGGVEGFRNQLLREFQQEIQGSTCRTLIISDEHFHSSLTTLEEIRRLRAFLEPNCRTIQIIVYLRRQDELCRSFHSEYIKGGGSDDKPLLEDGISYYYDYRALIENYENVFGADNIKVRVYEKSRLVNDDVIDDFIAVIGLGASESWERPARLNVSLSDLALRFLAEFNKIIPVSIGDAVNPDRVEIRSVLESYFPGNGWAVSRRWALEFHDRYRDSNEWVRRRFFPESNTLFSEDFSSYSLTTPEAGISAEDAVRVAATLWKHQAQALRNARSAADQARSAQTSVRERVQSPGEDRDPRAMPDRGNLEDHMPTGPDITPSFVALWRDRFQGVPLYCANEGSEGVQASEGWRDYTFRATTAGQKRIENYLREECGASSRIFHVGIGNSLLAEDFRLRVSTIVGISIEQNEVHQGLQLGISNYFPFLMNKYSLQFSQAFSSDFDFIVDNNPSTFCCCFFHLARMMTAYRRLMRDGGRIVTERVGLGWVVKGGNPRWSFDFDDWSRIAEVLGLSTSDINGEVFTMQHNAN